MDISSPIQQASGVRKGWLLGYQVCRANSVSACMKSQLRHVQQHAASAWLPIAARFGNPLGNFSSSREKLKSRFCFETFLVDHLHGEPSPPGANALKPIQKTPPKEARVGEACAGEIWLKVTISQMTDGKPN